MRSQKLKIMTRLQKTARAFALLTLSGSALSLSACGQEEESAFAPTCPHVEILGEAADSYQYDGRGLDAGSLVSHASMTGLTGNCEAAPKKSVRTRISVAMDVERGPAAKEQTITLPYFIAVLHDGNIIDKKMFDVPVTFEGNASSAVLRTPVRIIDVPASPDLQQTNYALEVGFQLTHAQLDYNRAHLRPANFHEKTN